MKKLFILIFVVCFSLMISAQTKTYVNQEPYFKFTYPSSYTKVKIQSAPHMVLKLLSEKDKLYCSLSVWDLDFRDDVDIWDDSLYDYLKKKAQSHDINGKVNTTKKYVTVNESIIKTIEYDILSYINVPNSKIRYPLYTTVYQFLHNGYMLEVSFASATNFDSSLELRKSIMKGFKF